MTKPRRKPMNAKSVAIAVVLDRSGSMEVVREDTIGGFNAFIDAQRAALKDMDVRVTLNQFDNQFETVYANRALAEVPKLTPETFVPRGGTALLDATGRTINKLGADLAKLPENKRPGKVIVVIQTDGHENASHEFSRETIRSMVQHQKDKYSWEFVFLGADQDAVMAGADIGIGAAQSVAYVNASASINAVMWSTANKVASAAQGLGPISYSAEEKADILSGVNKP